MRLAALMIVMLHALVLVGHDWAHRSLAIGLAPWQLAFVYAVIVAAPVIAAATVFTRFARGGYALLAISMLGSLVFSGYYHFVLISPDHVLHLPAGEGQAAVRATAVAMAALELAGIGAAAFALRKRTARSP